MAAKNKAAAQANLAKTSQQAQPKGRGNPETEGEVKENKSIVPSKYAGKYKDGGQGPLAEFIKAQCVDKTGDFSWANFFKIARDNGIDDAKVSTYEAAVAGNDNGGKGRARMTIGNMLRAIARKEQKLKGVNGKFVEVAEAKVELTGAAAAKKAEAKKAA